MNNFMRAEAEWLTPPEGKVLGECVECGDDLYEGSDAFKYDQSLFCSHDCIISYMHKKGYITFEHATGNHHCEECTISYELGELVLIYDGMTFCDEVCLMEYLESTGEVTLATIENGYDE